MSDSEEKQLLEYCHSYTFQFDNFTRFWDANVSMNKH